MMPNNELPRLKYFSVFGLHDRFNHRIQFKDDHTISIISAPNGYGKTAFMKLFDATINRKFNILASINYSKIVLEFDNKITFEITRTVDDESATPSISMRLSDDDGIHEFSFDFSYMLSQVFSGHSRRARRPAPYIFQVSENLWLDERTGEELDAGDILAMVSETRDFDPDNEQYRYISEFLDRYDCTLIGAQRTVSIDNVNRDGPRDRQRIQHGVEERATRLSKIVQDKLTEFSNLSQRLDSSFPKRTLDRIGEKNIPPDEDILRGELQALDERRASFAVLGLIKDTRDQVIAPQTGFDDQLRHVLNVYLEDNNRKLDTLDDLRKKISMFLNKINDKFVFKSVSTSEPGEIIILSEEARPLNLIDLSSGEQHEFILLFDLIFKSSSNTIFLIDEPEISLHIAWQKVFIRDLRDISEVTNFQSLIATHSPQIIGDNWDYVNEFSA